jgi:tetratricopeptide (TPR) repeat protein
VSDLIRGNQLLRSGKIEEAVAAYQSAIARHPSFHWSHYKLGEALEELGRWEEAIVAYQKAVELNPNSERFCDKLKIVLEQQNYVAEAEIIETFVDDNQGSFYYYQGQSQEHEGKYEEAIGSYLQAVKLSPESFDYCHKLGELLVQVNEPKHWDNVITLYQNITIKKPDLLWGYHFLGDALRNAKQWEKACQAYRLAISLSPDFLWSHFYLGMCAQELKLWLESIRAYERALDLNHELMYVNSAFINENIATNYYNLAEEYAAQGFMDEARECYGKALEKQPYLQPSYYYDLQNIIVRSYYESSLKDAQAGHLLEGMKCFTNLSILKTKGEIYDYIWRGLNSLGFLDETTSYCQLDLKQEAIDDYFTHTSTYRIINLWDVTADDKEFLKQSGLSITNLEIISKDNIYLEEIYINHFSSTKTQLTRNVVRNPQCGDAYWHTGMYLEQSIVETGYLYSVCPVSGRVIRSNQSFFVRPSFFYRFVGDEVFYLVVGDWYNARACIYFPRWDLLIRIFPADYIGIHTINSFKAYSVTNWQSFKSYISTPKKQVVAIIGDLMNNISHYMWDLAGFEYLNENNFLDKIDKVLVGPYDFLNISDLFPEIAKNKIEVFDNSINLYKGIVENNYCAVRVVELLLTKRLANRIYQASLKKCSALFLEEVEKSAQNFPLLWITIRSQRVWTSQIHGIANIINNLYVDFPNLSIIFDGWSRTEKGSEDEEFRIAIEIDIVEKIIALISPQINVYNAIGRMVYEKAVWVHAIDFFISPIGAGLSFTVSMADKPGVAHGNSSFMGMCDPYYQENSRDKLVLLPLDQINDEDNSFWFTRNYDCDWKAIYNQAVKILNGLSKKDKRAGIN